MESEGIVELRLTTRQAGWLLAYVTMLVEDADARDESVIWGACVDEVDEMRFDLMMQLPQAARGATECYR